MSSSQRFGLLVGLVAYLIWGSLPLYIRAMRHVQPQELLAHRIIWSVPTALVLIAVAANWRGRRSPTSSRSTACVSCSRTAPGGWCAPRPTSRNWWWWWKARPRRGTCGPSSPGSTPICRAMRKSANTTRRSDGAALPALPYSAAAGIWMQASASSSTSGPASCFTPFSLRVRRQARAPGTAENSPVMWRVIWCRRCPRAISRSI